MNKFIGKQTYQDMASLNPRIEDAHGAISVCLELSYTTSKYWQKSPSREQSFLTKSQANASQRFIFCNPVSISRKATRLLKTCSSFMSM